MSNARGRASRMSAFIGGLVVLAAASCGTETEPSIAETQSALETSGVPFTDRGGNCAGGEASQCTVFGDKFGHDPTTMHCCPKGTAMQGYFATTDSFICRSVPFDQGLAFQPGLREKCVWRSVQTPKVEFQQMLGCQGDEYMAGFHRGLNRIACCPTTRLDTTATPPANITTHVRLFVDGNDEPPSQGVFAVRQDAQTRQCTIQSQTHRCPETSLMFGLNLSQNFFMCAF